MPLIEAASWLVLRALRSEPPGWANSGKRRKTFSAALEQSEQLWKASGSVGPSTQPILQFYGLVQGGVALCAALAREASWEAPHGHGLQLRRSEPAGGHILALTDIEVLDAGLGSFPHVAKLLGSPTLPTGATLEAILCSLPEKLLFGSPTPARPPLQVSVDVGMAPAERALVRIGPMPRGLTQHQVDAAGRVIRCESPAPTSVHDWLSDYPRLAELGMPVACRDPLPDHLDQPERLCYSVQVEWRLRDPALDLSALWAWGEQLMDIPGAPGTGPSGVVLPALANNTRPLHPLVTWWASLYAGSMLARYYPREWTALLDVDRSPLAVPLSQMLEVASDAVPRLLAQALLNEAASD